MPASPPNVAPLQYDPTQYHSEFGYFAPTMRFRRKVALTLKGGALGALAGAVAMFMVVMERGEERAFTMVSAPVQTIPAPSVAAAPAPSMRGSIVAPAAAAPMPVVAMPMASKPGAPAREPFFRVAMAPPPPAPASTPASSRPAPLTPAQIAAVDLAKVRFVPQSSALPAAVPANPADRGPAPPPVAVGPLDLVPGAVAGAPVQTAPKPKKKIVREPQPERTAHPVPNPGQRSAFAAEPSVPRFLRSIFGL